MGIAKIWEGMAGLWRRDCYLCHAPLAPGAGKNFLCLRCLWQIDWIIDAEILNLRENTNLWKNQSANLLPNERRHCLRCGIHQFALKKFCPEYCPSCVAAIEELEKVPDFRVTRGFPLAYYQGLFERLLQWYKFSRELPVAGFFAALLQRAYRRDFNGYYLVPVPPRASKLKREAWDQITYLSGLLQRRYRLPVLRLLERNANSAEQKQQNRRQRLGQVRSGSYALALQARRLAWREFGKTGPLRLLLLDDVYTTGATVAMCRRALQSLEAEGWVADVRALTLCAVAQHKDEPNKIHKNMDTII